MGPWGCFGFWLAEILIHFFPLPLVYGLLHPYFLDKCSSFLLGWSVKGQCVMLFFFVSSVLWWRLWEVSLFPPQYLREHLQWGLLSLYGVVSWSYIWVLKNTLRKIIGNYIRNQKWELLARLFCYNHKWEFILNIYFNIAHYIIFIDITN